MYTLIILYIIISIFMHMIMYMPYIYTCILYYTILYYSLLKLLRRETEEFTSVSKDLHRDVQLYGRIG